MPSLSQTVAGLTDATGAATNSVIEKILTQLTQE